MSSTSWAVRFLGMLQPSQEAQVKQVSNTEMGLLMQPTKPIPDLGDLHFMTLPDMTALSTKNLKYLSAALGVCSPASGHRPHALLCNHHIRYDESWRQLANSEWFVTPDPRSCCNTTGQQQG